jgi:outer membrane protein
VLTGGRQRADEAVARAELDQAQTQQRQVNELAVLDARSAWAELVAARASWDSSAGTIEQANRAYQIAEVRYDAGVSTQLELADARLLLVQAEANRAQASRDLQIARARVALLPELPLGVGQPGGGGGGFQQDTPVRPAPPAPQPPTGGQFTNVASAQAGGNR